MMKYKPIILSLMILIQLPSDSITSNDNDFSFNTTITSKDSLHLQHLKVQSFINDLYTLNKTTIHNTVIRLENTSVSLYNVNVTGSKILADGAVDYSVLFDNCVFEDSEIVIDSASNVTILNSHFRMEDIRQEEEPNHVVRIYNTGFLFMTDTHFGNQLKQHNYKDTINSEIIKYTNLGMKMENVSIGELTDCSFTGIKAEKNSGSAIFLQNAEKDVFLFCGNTSNFHFFLSNTNLQVILNNILCLMIPRGCHYSAISGNSRSFH